MNFTPITEAEIRSELSVEEIVKRLSDQVELPTTWTRFLPIKRRALAGSIVDHKFSFIRMLNSSRISGQIRPDEKGAVIKIHCKLGPVLNGVIRGQAIGFGFFSVFVLLGVLYTFVTKGFTAEPLYSSQFIIALLLLLLPYMGYVQTMKRVLTSNVDYFNMLLSTTKRGAVTDATIDFTRFIRGAAFSGFATGVLSWVISAALNLGKHTSLNPSNLDFVLFASSFFAGSASYSLIVWLIVRSKRAKDK